MYGDGGGLWLTVRSPTSRSWLFIYMIDGISRRMGLGPYPEVTLAVARELAAEARGLVKAHRDPRQGGGAGAPTPCPELTIDAIGIPDNPPISRTAS
jgi:hypothetical protein